VADHDLCAHIFPGTISAVVVYFSCDRHFHHHRGEPVVSRLVHSATPEWGAMLDAGAHPTC